MQSISGFELFNWFVIVFFVALGLAFFYQSRVNLTEHRWVRFSWDDIAFYFASLVRGKKYATYAKMSITTSPQQIQRYGRLALIRGLISIGISIYWYIRFLN